MEVIDVYTSSTPAGYSVTITLEEMGLPYTVHHMDIGALEHKQPAFLKLNPNGRIPAIHDHETGVTLWESAAIRLYLAEKTGMLLPKDPARRWEAVAWLMLQVSGVGPNQGQANCFIHYFGEDLPSVVSRFKNETRRLYGVIDRNLQDREYLAGEFSIADCGVWPWVRIADYAHIGLEEFPNVRRWFAQVGARPGVLRGQVPKPRDVSADNRETGRKIVMR